MLDFHPLSSLQKGYFVSFSNNHDFSMQYWISSHIWWRQRLLHVYCLYLQHHFHPSTWSLLILRAFFSRPFRTVYSPRGLTCQSVVGHSEKSAFVEGWFEAVKPSYFLFVVGGCLLNFVLMNISKLYGKKLCRWCGDALCNSWYKSFDIFYNSRYGSSFI